MEPVNSPKASSWKTRLKNKKVIALIVVIAILLVGAGAYAFMSRSGDSSSPTSTFEEDLPELSPEDIGMEVTVRGDKKAIMFELTEAGDIVRVEYVIEYEKELDGERVPEGIFGEMNIADDGITKTDFREFGTCSSGVCRYDKVVSDVKIELKVEKEDGKTYRVVKTVEL